MSEDIEQIGNDLARRGFHLDLFRAIGNRETLAACWKCRLRPRPFTHYEADTPYAEADTAMEAIRLAMKQLPRE